MWNFLRDRRGGVALVAGLGLPVLLVAVSAATEYAWMVHRKTQLQSAADAASLAAAQQLRISNTPDSVVQSVAQATADGVAPPADGAARSVGATVLNRRSAVRVAIAEDVRSVMGQVMTLPTSQIGATATAQISGTAKLCLLTLDESKGKALNLDKNSRISANGCAVYSNSVDRGGLRADTGAVATASLICSAGGVDNKGAVLTPSPTTDCPSMRDPLATRNRPSTGSCPLTGLLTPTIVTSSTTLYPGTYCGGITIKGSASVTLASGIYVISNGPLIVSNSASVTGQNVGFFFVGNAGGVRFDPDTSVNLTAPKDGDMAGLLFFEDRSVSAPIPLPIGPTGIAPPPPPLGSAPMREYRISSNNVPNLLGTIYLPAGRLIIDAKRPVAERSAYTVVVVRQLDLNSGPNLVLNSDYAATDIPVPEGVGSKSGNLSLVQ